MNFNGKITPFQTSIDLINKYFNISLIYSHCTNQNYKSMVIEISSFQKNIMKLAVKLEKIKGQFTINELITYVGLENPNDPEDKIIANIIDLKQNGFLKVSNF